jgi:hypothetical protein
MADGEADELTNAERGQGVIVMLVTWLGITALVFLLNWLAQSDVLAAPAPHHPKGSHGHLDPSSPVYWILFVSSVGLSALPPMVALPIGAVVGFAYGAEASLLASYDLKNPGNVFALIVDITWSLPNTIFGAAIGTPFYLIVGKPSRSQSRGQAWVSFQGSLGPSLQTLGTVNLGGAGKHEKVHVLQARILGPSYLPLQLGSYLLNGLIQCLWTISLGALLRVLKVRDSAWFRPARDSVVKSDEGNSGAGDFFGWIYRYTLMEIWAYATE